MSGPGDGGGFDVSVNPVLRPKTGMHSVFKDPASKGHRRVQDQSFYASALRKHLLTLDREIERMHRSMATHRRQTGIIREIEHEQNTLKKEISGLDATLATHNLLLQHLHHTESSAFRVGPQVGGGSDSDGSGTGSDSLTVSLRQLIDTRRTDVSELSQRADSMLVSIKDTEDHIALLQQKFQQLEQSFVERLQEAPDHISDTYQVLRSREDHLDQQVGQTEEEFSEAAMKLEGLKSEVEKDISKINYLSRLEEKESLARQVSEARDVMFRHKNVHLELRKKNEQLRVSMQKLLQAIKDARIRKRTVVTSIKRKKQLLAQYKNPDGQFQKLQKLRDGKREFRTFISQFPDRMKETQSELSRNRQKIVDVLEFISKDSDVEIRPDQQFASHRAILNDQVRRRDDAMSTLERLKLELTKKQKQRANLVTVNDRIIRNLEEVTEDITRMKNELRTYEQLDEMSDSYAKLKADLARRKTDLELLRTQQINWIHRLTRQKEHFRKKLQQNPVYEDLAELQRKLRYLEQSNHDLSQFIEERASDMDYNDDRSSCLGLIARVNDLLRERAQQQ